MINRDELNEVLDQIHDVVKSTTEAFENLVDTVAPVVEELGKLCGEYAVILRQEHPDYVNNRRSVNPKTRGKKW